MKNQIAQFFAVIVVIVGFNLTACKTNPSKNLVNDTIKKTELRLAPDITLSLGPDDVIVENCDDPLGISKSFDEFVCVFHLNCDENCDFENRASALTKNLNPDFWSHFSGTNLIIYKKNNGSEIARKQTQIQIEKRSPPLNLLHKEYGLSIKSLNAGEYLFIGTSNLPSE